MGAVAKSYIRKGFLIYEEMRKYLVIQYIRKPLVIYDFANSPFWISLYMRKIVFSFFFFISVALWCSWPPGLSIFSVFNQACS